MMDRLELMFRRSMAYRACFLDAQGNLTPAGRIVMADLERFCAATSGTTVVSPVSRQTDVPASFQREGRREVFTRLWRFLRLPTSQMYELEDKTQ